jgi:hypothetical protein
MVAQASESSPVGDRGRSCLLKGCGRRFIPRPQDRWRAKYCSPPCRAKARRWRKRLGRKLSRLSTTGREAKRRENRRYRETHPDYPRRYREHHRDRVRAIERASKRRSRRRSPCSGDVHKGAPRCRLPCHRPGCDLCFVTWRSMVGFRRYCREACRAVMRRFSGLLAQLRYRRTAYGNYRRKLTRGRAPPLLEASAGGL